MIFCARLYPMSQLHSRHTVSGVFHVPHRGGVGSVPVVGGEGLIDGLVLLDGFERAGVLAHRGHAVLGHFFMQRVQHLIEGGVIMGSGFDVNPKSLGYSTCTYVGITLERGSMYKDVVECLQHIPEVVECHFTTGPYTMLVKLYARDNEQLMHLLNGRLQDIPGVVATETLISLEQSIKREIPVTIEG